MKNNSQKIIFIIFVAVLLVIAFVGGVYYMNPSTRSSVAATKNIVRYSRPESGIAIQFELPEGYGAVEDVEGEGGYRITYAIGTFAPESGTHVLQTSLSMADSVRIIPSYDPQIVTLEDWRAKGDVTNETDAIDVQNLQIAGVPARVLTIGGMGITRIIQFVKDKNYYEISTEGSLQDKAIAKIINTFTFRK